jgi:DNA-binding response OmpR family regulator
LPAAVRGLLDGLDQASEDIMRTSFEPSHPVEPDRIFVVESDEVIRSALQFILDDHSETCGFTSLDQAFAKAVHRTPDIVLLGIGFVHGNGESTLAEVAKGLPGAKILIVANSVNDPLALASLQWGAHDVMGKPLTFDSVHRKVEALLGRHDLSPTMLGLMPLSAAW